MSRVDMVSTNIFFADGKGFLKSRTISTGYADVISTACYIYSVGGDQFRVAYSKDYASQLFDYAQLTNIALDDDDGYIGIDMLIRSNPETIFCDEGVAEIIAVQEPIL